MKNKILDKLRQWLGVRSPSLEQQGYYRCINCRYCVAWGLLMNPDKYQIREKECYCKKHRYYMTRKWTCKKFKPRRKNK